MGIQVRRVLKARAKAASDHACQTDQCLAHHAAAAGPPQPRTLIAKGQLPARRPRHHAHSKGFLVTRVYRMFGLRHGVMMIAIHDLLWSTFIVFLLVLAAAHSREVSCIVEGDMKVHAAEHEAAERAENMAGLGLAGSLADQENRSSYYMQYVQLAYEQARTMVAHDNNEVKLHTGLHFATMMTMLMVFGISMAGIDMIASMMLFAGATLNVRQLMMPWLSLRLIELLLGVFGSLIVMLVWARGMMLLKMAVFTLVANCIVSYHWTAAYSLHEHLCRLERGGGGGGAGGVHHTTRPPMYSPCECLGPAAPPPPRTKYMPDLDSRVVWRSVVSYHHGCASDSDLGKMIAAATSLPCDPEGVAAAEQADLLTGTSHLSATTPPADMVAAGCGGAEAGPGGFRGMPTMAE